MWNCKYCNKEFENLSASQKANHSRWCDKNPKKEKYLNKLETIRNNISIESREKQSKTLSKSYKEGKAIVNWRSFEGKQHSIETKDKIKKGRKKFLSENPEKHPWRKNTKFISEPCEYLKNILRENNILFEEEFQPLLPNRFFSIDIAFPRIKIGIEINGNQHYNKNETLKSYYQDRHDLIEKNGWKLIEIPYKKVYNDNIKKQILVRFPGRVQN